MAAEGMRKAKTKDGSAISGGCPLANALNAEGAEARRAAVALQRA